MNPLLERRHPIPFGAITPADLTDGVRTALARARGELDELLAKGGPRSYANTIAALDEIIERVEFAVRLTHHLTSVHNTPEVRAAHNEVLPEYSAFFASLPLDTELWRAVREVEASDEARALEPMRARRLEVLAKEFRRAGADLPDDAKRRMHEIGVELSALGTKFGENVLDATNAFTLHLEDEHDLAGLPERMRDGARRAAKDAGRDGWLFTLHAPSFTPFMRYSERRDLRERMYRAFTNRATGGPNDNTDVMQRILRLRREQASILGYATYADYKTEDRMAKSAKRVREFLEDLTGRTRPHYEREIAELRAYARERLGLDSLEPWDIYGADGGFVGERLRRERYALDEEELRPYFPLDRVQDGLFSLAQRLFGVSITERHDVDAWDDTVRLHDIHDEDGTHIASFYTDWLPRATKRGGAWHNTLITGGPAADATAGSAFEPHLSVITGNFTPPSDDAPTLLSHREVQTVFHEFGHLLHQSLSRVPERALGGTNVAWDFVELPSQIMENWTWEREALDRFARRYDTGAPIPEALFERMVAARRFMGAGAQMRQLSFATVDQRLHTDYDPERDGPALEYAQRAFAEFEPSPEFARNGRINAFTHLFSGGYAAGYYSYKWSEVLDADAFTRFQREGLFSREVGRAFVDAVLSRGDSAEPDALYREFMGRDPDPEALLRRTFQPGGASREAAPGTPAGEAS